MIDNFNLEQNFYCSGISHNDKCRIVTIYRIVGNLSDFIESLFEVVIRILEKDMNSKTTCAAVDIAVFGTSYNSNIFTTR